jgi:hypothetical protein
MNARCQALFAALAVALAAAVGWQENGRRGRQPSRPATSTVEVNVSENVRDDDGKGNGAARLRAAAHAWLNGADARWLAWWTEHRRSGLERLYRARWPKLDPCPVNLREDSEYGPRMRMGTTFASASTPREDVWYVETEPAERAFLDLIGRTTGAGGDADVAAAVKVLCFIVKASIMGTPADLDVLRGLAEQIDGKEAQRARVLRSLVRASESFAERPEPTARAIKEGFEHFPPPPSGPAGHEAIWELRDLILDIEGLAKGDPRHHDRLRALRRIVAVYELREDLSRIDPRFGELDPAFVYERLSDATSPRQRHPERMKAPALAAKLSAQVEAFDDRNEDQSRKAFHRAAVAMQGRRCFG